MGSRNLFSAAGHHHSPLPCSRTHQIGALVIVAPTFSLTRAFDRISCLLPSASSLAEASLALFDHAGGLTWPHRGYGLGLILKIYVYKKSEIDGLRELMRGRDDKISSDPLIKGQWETQGLLLLLPF